MEDYIYILIGIIWIVFSVIKGTKKSKTGTQPDKKNAIEEFLEEFLPPIRNPEPVVEEYNDSSYESIEEQAITKLENEEFSNALEYQYQDIELTSLEDSYEVKQQIYSQLIPEEPQKTSLTNQGFKQNTFDLRKAIIYNAILNRPYQN